MAENTHIDPTRIADAARQAREAAAAEREAAEAQAHIEALERAKAKAPSRKAVAAAHEAAQAALAATINAAVDEINADTARLPGELDAMMAAVAAAADACDTPSATRARVSFARRRLRGVLRSNVEAATTDAERTAARELLSQVERRIRPLTPQVLRGSEPGHIEIRAMVERIRALDGVATGPATRTQNQGQGRRWDTAEPTARGTAGATTPDGRRGRILPVVPEDVIADKPNTLAGLS